MDDIKDNAIVHLVISEYKTAEVTGETHLTGHTHTHTHTHTQKCSDTANQVSRWSEDTQQ